MKIGEASKTVKFRGRHNSLTGMISLITGSMTIILLIALIIIAASTGKVSENAGLAAVVAACVSFFGLTAAVIAVGERDIYTAGPIAGMIVNGISLILYVVIFVLGSL